MPAFLVNMQLNSIHYKIISEGFVEYGIKTVNVHANKSICIVMINVNLITEAS